MAQASTKRECKGNKDRLLKARMYFLFMRWSFWYTTKERGVSCTILDQVKLIIFLFKQSMRSL